MTTKATKPPVDWEAVERDYCAGILSVREVGRLHGVSHTMVNKKAAEKGWVRDLKAKIRAKADAEVAKDAVATSVDNGNSHAREKQIIEANAAIQVNVIRGHRATLARLNAIVESLAARLEKLIKALGEMQPGAELPEDVSTTLRLLMGERESPADLLEKLSRASSKLIPLERQAFGLKDDNNSTNGAPDAVPLTDRLRTYQQAEAIEASGGKVVELKKKQA